MVVVGYPGDLFATIEHLDYHTRRGTEFVVVAPFDYHAVFDELREMCLVERDADSLALFVGVFGPVFPSCDGVDQVVCLEWWA